MPTPRWIHVVLGYVAAAVLLEGRSPPPPAAVQRTRAAPEETLDPGRMTPRSLRRLPGVGTKLALAIDDARAAHDPRTGPLGWEDVPGIGPITHGKILGWFHRRGLAAETVLPGDPPPETPRVTPRE